MCQLIFIQLAQLIPFVPVPIQKKRLGTCTNGSSRKVSDASTQIHAILLARRTGKVWHYQGHPNHVETLPSLKKKSQQCGKSTPHQVVNPVPPNRQTVRIYPNQQHFSSRGGGYLPTVCAFYAMITAWMRTIILKWILKFSNEGPDLDDVEKEKIFLKKWKKNLQNHKASFNKIWHSCEGNSSFFCK